MAVTQLLSFPSSTQETEHQGKNWCDSNASAHLLQDPLCHLGQFFVYGICSCMCVSYMPECMCHMYLCMCVWHIYLCVYVCVNVNMSVYGI